MDDIQSQLIRYCRSNTVRYLSDIYNSKSLFEILSKERDEIIHSRMLRWLFELDDLPCSWHDYPIMKLLLRLIERADQQNKSIDAELKTDILSGRAKITIKKVELEIPTTGIKVNGQSGLIDILIECDVDGKADISKLVICIENKVESREHDYQTWKYYSYLKGVEKAKNLLNENNEPLKDDKIEIEGESKYEPTKEERQLFVVLTPHAESEMDTFRCSCPAYIHINYQDVMDYILSELLKMKDLNRRSYFILKEYADTLSLPYINNKNTVEIMAINKEHSKLLTHFWEENKQLIIAALNAFQLDSNQDEEERNQIEQATKLLSQRSNRFTVVINGNISYNLKMWEVAKLVCDYLLQKANYSIEVINDKLKVERITTLLIHQEEFDQLNDKDKGRWKKLGSNPDIYVSSQWYYNVTENIKKPNFTIFVKKVHELNIGIDILDQNVQVKQK